MVPIKACSIFYLYGFEGSMFLCWRSSKDYIKVAEWIVMLRGAIVL